MNFYDPKLIPELASKAGYSGVIEQYLLSKLMRDSGFNQIMALANRANKGYQATDGKRFFTRDDFGPVVKEGGLKDSLAGMALLGTLLNPMKGMADDAMLALAKSKALSSRPSITKEVEQAVDNLGFFKRMGAQAYGLEDIVAELARARALKDVMSKYRMPSMGAPELEKSIMGLKDSMYKTKDISLDDASKLFDRVKKFNEDAAKAVQQYTPAPSVAMR